MKRTIVVLLTGIVLIICAVSVSACGKQASHVDSPLGKKDRPFPRTYPDISTDSEM
ncbi:MAG: hypothetical protein FWE93_03510 [Alphaproteobacteria bacterium]|nr:hypothetical protein [Alphaproteobacteria bacterium]